MKRGSAWLLVALLACSALTACLSGCGGTKPREALPVTDTGDDDGMAAEADKGKPPAANEKGAPAVSTRQVPH
ncbi:MAG: hypothetical protein ACOX6M_11785 [Armatimonadota bacterium]|jgi:hypothetical protein|nr:hypothetical protein [Acidobacteriota bacterium]NLN89233.1 hypothetical protein [candidate division WS1 bacterium]